MAKDKIVVEYEADVSKIKRQLTSLEKDYKDLETTSAKSAVVATEGFNQTAKSASKLNQQVDNLSKKTDTAFNTKKVTELGKSFSDLPGPIGQASAAVEGLGKTFLKLLANPIVLTITALTAAVYGLFKAFTSTDAGATKFEGVMKSISVTFDVLKQRGALLVDVLVDISNGEFTKAAEDFGKAVNGVGKQISDATKAAIAYTNALDNLEDAESTYISQRAENANKIAKLEFEAADRSKSIKQRKAALEEAIKIANEESKRDVDVAKQRLDLEVTNAAAIIGIRKSTVEEAIKIDRRTLEIRAKYDEDYKKFLEFNRGETLVTLENFYAEAINKDTAFYNEQKRNSARLSAFNLELQQETEKQRLANLKKSVKFQSDIQVEGTTDAEKEMLGVKEEYVDEFADYQSKSMAKNLDIDIQLSKEADKQKAENAIKAEEEKQQQIRDLYEGTAKLALQLLDIYVQKNKERTDLEIQSINETTDKQLAALDARYQTESGNITKLSARERAYQKEKARLEKERDDAIKKLKHDEFDREKVAKLIQINIEGALASISAFARSGYIGLAFAIATTAASSALVASQPNPYAKGSPFVDKEGKYKRGVDSVPAILMPGERVVTVEDNKKHWQLLEATRTGKVNEFINYKYLNPALKKQREQFQQQTMLGLMGNNGSSFNDGNIVSELRKATKVSQKNTFELAKVFKSTRKAWEA